MDIGQRLKALRLSKAMTLQEVAEKLSISRGNISAIETGRTIPSLDMISKICQVLGCKVAIVFVDLKKVDEYEELIYTSKNTDKRFKS